MTALFTTGAIVATPGALAALAEANANPLTLLSRHVHGDRGDVSLEDATENETSVKRGF